MKEKRVDVYLAKAGFCQLLVIGFGGSFLTELVNDARPTIAIISAAFTIISAIPLYRYYVKASHLSKKK